MSDNAPHEVAAVRINRHKDAPVRKTIARVVVNQAVGGGGFRECILKASGDAVSSNPHLLGFSEFDELLGE
jgi:predicted GNAT family N-acyltransferase